MVRGMSTSLVTIENHYQVLIDRILESGSKKNMDKAIEFMAALGVGQERYAFAAESFAQNGMQNEEAVVYFDMGKYEDKEIYIRFADLLLAFDSPSGVPYFKQAAEYYQIAGVLEEKYENLGDYIFRQNTYGSFDEGLEFYIKGGVLDQKKDEVIEIYLDYCKWLEGNSEYWDAMVMYQYMLFVQYDMVNNVRSNNSVSQAFSDKATALSLEVTFGDKKATQELLEYIELLQQKAESFKE